MNDFKEIFSTIDKSKLTSTISKVDKIVELMWEYKRFSDIPEKMLPEISNSELLAYHQFCNLVGLQVAYDSLEKVLLLIEEDLKK